MYAEFKNLFANFSEVTVLHKISQSSQTFLQNWAIMIYFLALCHSPKFFLWVKACLPYYQMHAYTPVRVCLKFLYIYELKNKKKENYWTLYLLEVINM